MHMGAERIGPIDILNRLHRFDRCQPIGRRCLNCLSQKDRRAVFLGRRLCENREAPWSPSRLRRRWVMRFIEGEDRRQGALLPD